MEIVPVLFMIAFVKKVVDLLKYGTNGDWNGVVTQLVAWGAGIAIAFLTANSDFGANTQVNEMALSTLNGWTVVLAGIGLASSAGFGWDTLKSLDNKDTSAMPTLTPALRAPLDPVD